LSLAVACLTTGAILTTGRTITFSLLYCAARYRAAALVVDGFKLFINLDSTEVAAKQIAADFIFLFLNNKAAASVPAPAIIGRIISFREKFVLGIQLCTPG
jgi:hypothetical protein